MNAEIGCSSQSLPRDGMGSTPGAVLLGILSTKQDGEGGWQRRERGNSLPQPHRPAPW